MRPLLEHGGGPNGNAREPPANLITSALPPEPMRPVMISSEQLQEWIKVSRRDDCFDRLVPSDVRLMLGEIGRLWSSEAMTIPFAIDDNSQTGKELQARMQYARDLI